MPEDVGQARELAGAARVRGEWNNVVELLDPVDPGELTADDLFALYTARSAIGRWDDGVEALEMSYRRWVDEDDQANAAWSSLLLAFGAGARGDSAVSGGWVATAARHMNGLEESRAHVLAGVLSTFSLMAGGEFEAVVRSMVSAQEQARRLGERDLEVWALQREGHARVKLGEVETGMALIDEAMVAGLNTRLAPLVTQQLLCETLSLCQELGDAKRASQWIEAGDRAASARGLEWSGDCRIHRAGVMRQLGSLPRAEAEARLGSAEFEGGWEHNLHYSWGWSEIGEIRMRVGDLEGAAEAFATAHSLGRVPSPGPALLRMAQGEPLLAVAEIDRLLGDVTDPLGRVRLLEAAVAIRLAAGDVTGAERAADEMSATASTYGSEAFIASAACADGAIRCARGEHDAAATSLRSGIAGWLTVGAPYEAALARVRLAEALVAGGDHHSARVELQAARSTFLEHGAEIDAQRAASLLVDVDDGAPDPSTGQRVEKTFMFTDIQQSTALAAAMGDDDWDRILRAHDRLLREAIRAEDGHVVKHEGDGLFAAFDDASSAARAAVAIQQRLAAHREEHGFAPYVRIGLHAGEATERHGDFFGMAVNTAARVMSLAVGGEIVASDSLAELPGVDFGEPRVVELKGLSEPTRVVDIVWRASS